MAGRIHRFVSGMLTGPRPEITSRSVFYSDALAQIYKNSDPAYPVQETGSQELGLEQSNRSSVSITSEDAVQISNGNATSPPILTVTPPSATAQVCKVIFVLARLSLCSVMYYI